jgi:hypothetical protein
MQSELELVVAAGFDASKLSLMNVYDIGGNIIRDEDVRRESLATGLGVDAGRLAVLVNMSEADRAALRDRVTSG